MSATTRREMREQGRQESATTVTLPVTSVLVVALSLKHFILQQVTKVIVYIEETNSMADVTFPSLPHVVSLLHYDNIAVAPDNLQPPAGYPVICVTVSQHDAKDTVWI